jgi:hypothetical protein
LIPTGETCSYQVSTTPNYKFKRKYFFFYHNSAAFVETYAQLLSEAFHQPLKVIESATANAKHSAPSFHHVHLYKSITGGYFSSGRITICQLGSTCEQRLEEPPFFKTHSTIVSFQLTVIESATSQLLQAQSTIYS